MAKLIKINDDGSDGEVKILQKNCIKFGCNIINDIFVEDAINLHCEIVVDSFGRVSLLFLIFLLFLICGIAL